MPTVRLLAPVADEEATGASGDELFLPGPIAARLVSEGRAQLVTETRRTAVEHPGETR